MTRNNIAKGIKRFVRLNLSIDRWNTQFGFQVVLLLLLAVSWSGSTIHAGAKTPNEDTIYLRFQCQKLREMQEDFYKKNKAALKKLRWDRRRGIFLVVDETYDPYYGKKKHKWICSYKCKKGTTGSFKFLTFALVAPRQWRKVIRCVPLTRKQDTTQLIVETAVEIKKEVKYDAILLDRGFYEKEIAFALQRANTPFLIRAELRGKYEKKLQRIRTCKRCLHWQQNGYDPLSLWLGWKKQGDKKYGWGFLTNIPNLSWVQCLTWYKQRWNIENVFKATDGIQFKTATSKIKPRLFAVLLSFLVYNEWQQYKYTTKISISLAIFVEEWINNELILYMDKGPPIKLHIPGWLLKVKE